MGERHPSAAYLWNFLSVVQLSQAPAHWFVASVGCSSEANPPTSIPGVESKNSHTSKRLFNKPEKDSDNNSLTFSFVNALSGEGTSGLCLKVAGINTCEHTIWNGKQVAREGETIAENADDILPTCTEEKETPSPSEETNVSHLSLAGFSLWFRVQPKLYLMHTACQDRSPWL